MMAAPTADAVALRRTSEWQYGSGCIHEPDTALLVHLVMSRRVGLKAGPSCCFVLKATVAATLSRLQARHERTL
jgi:hypothetical protein